MSSGLREQNRVQQRERILSAAFRLLTRESFEDVTMTAVARAAGVSRGTVFNHFSSKRGLVDAITAQVLTTYRGMLDASLADERTPTAAIARALFDRMAVGIESQRRVQRGVFREIARLQVGLDEGGVAQQAGQETRERLIALLARGQARGELHSDHPPEALASAFTSLANGTITEWLFEDASDSLRERMRAAVEIFLAGACADASASRALPLPTVLPAPAERSEP